MLKPPWRELKQVSARVALRPTSQSDSERHFAASASGRICSSLRRFSHASTIAPVVIDRIQRRLIGLSMPPNSMMFRKISSPSRAASQALTMRSTSLRFASFSTFLRRCSDCSMGSSSNFSGTAGRTLKFQASFLPFGPIGMRSSTRDPTAEVMIAASFSKWMSRPAPTLLNVPRALESALARSFMTDGFSAMISVLGMDISCLK